MPEPRRFWAPGRVNLIGEHTDHTDGLVLPAAIDLGITLTAELGGTQIRLRSTAKAGELALPADGRAMPASGWGRFVAAVAAELADAGRAPVGMSGELSSNLPRGAGLASSAALEVVVALGLLAAAGREMEPMALAALCRRAEHRATGVPTGIMDQAASLLGHAGSAILLDCGSLVHHAVPLPADRALVVLDSGIRRRLSSSAYAERTRELAAALPALDGRRPADVDPTELPGLLERLDTIPGRRLRHVVTENERVRATERALRHGDIAAVGELFAASHASLRDDFEVSIPEIDLLVELARDAGADAARMTGGGFGGAVIAIVPEAQARAVAARVVERYGRRVRGHGAAAHRCRAGDGARELATPP